MSKVFSNTLCDSVDAPQWLASYASANKEKIPSIDPPTRKSEDWRYTSLRALEQADYSRSSYTLDKVEVSQNLFDIADLDAIKLVFVDGQYCSTLSSDIGEVGVNISLFSQASDADIKLIQQHLGSVVKTHKHPFALINSGQLGEGVLVHANKNCCLNKPIQLVHVSTARKSEFCINARALVVLDEGSSVEIIEQFVSTADKQNSFVNSVTECIVKENASLTNYRIQNEQENIIHIGGVHARLYADARLNSFYLALGAKIKRCDVYVEHAGKGSECVMNGIYLPRGSQHVDYHTCVDHSVAHGTTTENFRGVIADKAHAVFNGRIHILPDAQKTLAQMSNKNLLTSNKAQINTKPELEIYADDVQCAHGATISQLDYEALHYLRSRGLGLGQARTMLSYGFINELILGIDNDAVKEYLRPLIEVFFSLQPNGLQADQVQPDTVLVES